MTAVNAGAIRRAADAHAVYRMFDEGGRLLYVGMSGRAGKRFDQQSEKIWFPLVSVITLEWHTTHKEAVIAEKRAIAIEHPRYNIAGALPRRARPLPALPPADSLSDVLAAFGDDRSLHWDILAQRLDLEFRERWDGATGTAVRMTCCTLGIPSVQVRMGSHTRRGCRRADVEQAFRRQHLKTAS